MPVYGRVLQTMNQTTAWAHLPNAALIDGVLASLKAHPEKWAAARDTAWNTVQSAAWGAAWSAAWDAARDAARAAAWDAAREAAWVAAGDVIATLIAYDDAGQFMKLPVEQLKAMYRLDPHPMYLLLQPTAAIFAEV